LKHIKYLGCVALGAILVLSVIVGAIWAIFPECKDPQALERAKSISSAHWQKIYTESEALMSDAGAYYHSPESLPESMAALAPVSAIPHASSLWVYLATCTPDNKVIVMVNTSGHQRGTIDVQWGDPGEQLRLWSKPNN
jgi:hypothetical protein